MRILITGASGSGSTTLGRALAAKLRADFLDADELYWLPTKPPFQQKRDGAQRRVLLRERLRNQPIVVAGSIMNWDAESEDSFDLIVFLQVPAEIRVARLRARELAQLGQVDEEFIAWAAQYDDGRMTGRSLARHLAWLAERRCRVVRFSGTQSVAELLSNLSQQLMSSVPVVAPRLLQDSCRDQLERRFLEQLNYRAEKGGWYADSWSHLSDHVVISIALTKGNAVVRTTRVDFFGTRLVLGLDETHSFVTELNPASPDVKVVSTGAPEALADVAADWLESEIARWNPG